MKILLFLFFISFNLLAEEFRLIAESDLNDLIDKFHHTYQNFVEKNYQAHFEIRSDWKNDLINSMATRPHPKEFLVTISGGMARAKGMTKGALLIVLCHELGHHIGGAPHTKRYEGWPSAEGQADYFSTSKCIKKMYSENYQEDVVVDSTVPEKIMHDCHEVYSDFKNFKICVKSELAVLDYSKFLNQLPSTKIPTNLNTPDNKQVNSTNINDYPRPQCRIDTLYQGVLCPLSFNEVLSDTDASYASCNDLSQFGARPMCWFQEKNKK